MSFVLFHCLCLRAEATPVSETGRTCRLFVHSRCCLRRLHRGAQYHRQGHLQGLDAVLHLVRVDLEQRGAQAQAHQMLRLQGNQVLLQLQAVSNSRLHLVKGNLAQLLAAWVVGVPMQVGAEVAGVHTQVGAVVEGAWVAEEEGP